MCFSNSGAKVQKIFELCKKKDKKKRPEGRFAYLTRRSWMRAFLPVRSRR